MLGVRKVRWLCEAVSTLDGARLTVTIPEMLDFRWETIGLED